MLPPKKFPTLKEKFSGIVSKPSLVTPSVKRKVKTKVESKKPAKKTK